MQILLCLCKLVISCTIFCRVSLATIGVCIFCALASVGALFVFVGQKAQLIKGGQMGIFLPQREKTERKNYDEENNKKVVCGIIDFAYGRVHNADIFSRRNN